jgi:hypothetical protein
MLNPRKLEGHMPKTPNYRCNHDYAAATQPVDESRQQPCSPADLFKEREHGRDYQPDDGISHDVFHEPLDRKQAPSA